MKKFLLIANWKMNPDSPERAILLARKIEQGISKLGSSKLRNIEVVIAPPFLFLSSVAKVFKKIKLGAQNTFWVDKGPFTGEVSWHQLKNVGAQYVIVGHSERKANLGETDSMINKKVYSLLSHGMETILCVGERERSIEGIPALVGEQLRAALNGVKKRHLKNLVIAYEPIWAISTVLNSMPDTPDNAFRATVFIRRVIAGLYGNKDAGSMRIIYGGSVNEKNITGFLKEGRMQGALIGGSSLRPEEFINIIRLAAQI